MGYGAIDPTKDYSEEDIKLQYITPAIEKAGWSKNRDIRMEYKITDGRVELSGNTWKRKKPKSADYLLFAHDEDPIAIVEAKSNEKSVSSGLQQAIDYAKLLDVPFAYASNGDGFVEFDFTTGEQRDLALDEFPTKKSLIERRNADKYGGEPTPEQAHIIEQPYYTGQNFKSPRYYQRVAINRTVEAIMNGQDRILLVMATGTGKTFTAFQIVYRLLKSGLKKKILYLADRNILVDQSIQQDFSPLAKSVHKIDANKENKTTLGAYEVYFSLYQQLIGGEDENEEKFRDLFDPDFFDLVIVDECHRGSAKEDSCWRKILEYFKSATQIGMTATPKETQYVSNISYFGEPLYTYSLKNGIDDGFLAPYRVINVVTNISAGWQPVEGQTDSNGDLIENRVYNNNDFDVNIVLLDRTREVAEHITDFLKKTDRMAKTIVFCPTQEAALRMRDELVKLNADKMKENSDYVVRITSEDSAIGDAKLKAFISLEEQYPVIATTSDKLTTGVDCKLAKLIVLDRPVSSMTTFKQIIGRGTRINEEKGKLYFTVMDFRNVTRLFADPDWDGEPVVDPDFPHEKKEKPDGGDGDGTGEGGDPPQPKTKPIVERDGCLVYIMGEIVSVYSPDGRLLRTENVVDYTKHNICGKYPTLEAFISHWRETSDRDEIRKWFEEHDVDLEALKKEQDMEDADDFDFLCHVAYGRKPLSRRERARKVQGSDFFSRYSDQAREVLEELLEFYANSNVSEIEDMNILKLSAFSKFGTPLTIANKIFGGKDKYIEAIHALIRAMYAV